MRDFLFASKICPYNGGMKRFFFLSLLLILGLGMYFASLRSIPQEELFLSAQFNPTTQLPQINLPMREPAQASPRDHLKASGLSDDKIQALMDLESFHQHSPALTEENFIRRQEFLNILNDRPEETISAFRNLMKLPASEDGLKSFTLNITMALNVSPEAKASVFVQRIREGAQLTTEGMVKDEEMSIMIGLSHLSRISNEGVKKKSLAVLLNQPLYKNSSHHRQLLKDYFPH